MSIKKASRAARANLFPSSLAALSAIVLLFLAACASNGSQPQPEAAQLAGPSAPVEPTPTLNATVAARPVVERATPTASPSPSPTPDLPPDERLALAETLMHHENFSAAAEQYAVVLGEAADWAPDELLALRYKLGLARLRSGDTAEAVEQFSLYLSASAAAPDGLSPEAATAYFHLAEALAAQGETDDAIGAYRSYLEAHPDMGAYVQPLIASVHMQAGEIASAIAAYEEGLTAGSQRLHEVFTRFDLAELYLQNEAYAEAAAQYDAIYALARTENTRGQVTYLAGEAALKADDTETAYARFQRGVNDYPRSPESYKGLVELVSAGEPVDDFQRGLVDYYAGAYAPAIEAFGQLIAAQPDAYPAEAHLYTAWSHEALGDLDAALAELDRYATAGATDSEPEPFAVSALYEEAALRARAGQITQAEELYRQLLETNPEHEKAPEAAWQLAQLRAQEGDIAGAITAYQNLADSYPAFEKAAPALFDAGWLAYEAGDVESARAAWEHLTDIYPQSDAGGAGYVWLLRTTPAEEAEALAAEVITNTVRRGYYPLRAREIVEGGVPFTPPTDYQFEFDEAAQQAEAEAWLGEWLPEVAVTSTLTTAVTLDDRYARGTKLWLIGLRPEARDEFESLRQDFADDAMISYQLALYYRDAGLYRSSIAAAASVLALSGETVFDAPSLIGQLLYPVHYADLILPLAEQYGYDPLLQFALVRQESLYETFVASFAGAQGLSQVMPATGADIAQRLQWPEYENADLYHPYVGLAFGAYYIAGQLDYFDGSTYAALAAYNAGPGNTAAWYEEAGSDPDRFLETVSFAETRLYIERIYEGYQYYYHLYGR